MTPANVVSAGRPGRPPGGGLDRGRRRDDRPRRGRVGDGRAAPTSVSRAEPGFGQGAGSGPPPLLRSAQPDGGRHRPRELGEERERRGRVRRRVDGRARRPRRVARVEELRPASGPVCDRHSRNQHEPDGQAARPASVVAVGGAVSLPRDDLPAGVGEGARGQVGAAGGGRAVHEPDVELAGRLVVPEEVRRPVLVEVRGPDDLPPRVGEAARASGRSPTSPRARS